jgi:pheromone shutdown protein TraB
MGMPFSQPSSGCLQGTGKNGVDWLGDFKPETVSIEIDTDRLHQLLREHQLYVQDFSCADESSKACVRRLLLAMLSHTV